VNDVASIDTRRRACDMTWRASRACNDVASAVNDMVSIHTRTQQDPTGPNIDDGASTMNDVANIESRAVNDVARERSE
jgi:hypothetical protein